jgi:hypothetical protein
MIRRDIHEHMKKQGTWVNWQVTTDTFKGGDPDKPVRKIAVAWKARWDALKTAVERGADLFVSHESIGVCASNSSADPEVPFALPTEKPKFDWLASTGLTVYRCHDVWDRFPGLGIRDSWQRELQLGGRIIVDEMPLPVTQFDRMPLRAFARDVARRVATLGQSGVLGAILFGGPEQLTLAFNTSDVWDYRVNPGQGLPPDKTTFDEMVAMAAREDRPSYNKLFAHWLAAENSSGPSLQSCGQVSLALLPGERPVGVRQSVERPKARANVRCEYVDYRDNKQTVDVGVFVPARDNVIPVTISSDQQVWGKLRLWRQHSLDYGPPRSWQMREVAGIDMSIPDSVDFTLAVRVLGAAGAWETTAAETHSTFRPCPGTSCELTRMD